MIGRRWKKSTRLINFVLCGFLVFKQDFSVPQWNRDDKLSCCKTCVEKQKEAGTPYECANCHIWKSEAAFDANVLSYRHFRRVCKDCDEKRVCGKCGKLCSKIDFTDGEWKHAAWTQSKRGVCHKCMKYNAKVKRCSNCH